MSINLFFSSENVVIEKALSHYTHSRHSFDHGNTAENTFNTGSPQCQFIALKDKPNTPQALLLFETKLKCIFAKAWLKQLHWGVLM